MPTSWSSIAIASSIAELDTNRDLADTVDIVLYDTFAQAESDHDEISVLVRNPRARHVVMYTWNFHPDLIDGARAHGVHGYLSKALPARDFVRLWKRSTPARLSSTSRRPGRALSVD